MQSYFERIYDLLAKCSYISCNLTVASHFSYLYECMLSNHRDTKLFLDMIMSQPQSSHNTMSKKGKKKSKATEDDLDLEILLRIEIIYEDINVVTGAEPEFKWGQIYPMIKDQNIPDAGLEYIPIYANIMRSGMTKVARHL